MTITVAIIEDNRLVREGITDMLNELPDVKVVLAATSLETARLKEANPRVVLLDIGLQDTDCLRVAETVRKEMVDSHVIVMDLLPVHEEIAQFVNVGVAGFILKDATFEDFVGTIRSVAEGQRVLPPRMTGTLFSQIAVAAVQRGRTAALEAVHMTQRERVCRWSDMMQSLREHDVSWWAGAFLAALKRGSPSALQSVHISGSPFQHAPDVRQPTS